jgi:hypothetical protein
MNFVSSAARVSGIASSTITSRRDRSSIPTMREGFRLGASPPDPDNLVREQMPGVSDPEILEYHWNWTQPFIPGDETSNLSASLRDIFSLHPGDRHSPRPKEGNARRTIIISDRQGMQEGKTSFETNKQCKKDKNDSRRTSNARRTIIILNERSIEEEQESFQTNKQCKKDNNHFRRTGNARTTRII